MFIKVEVAKYEQQGEKRVLSGISGSRIINKNHIVTAVNERAISEDGEFLNTCKIRFINGESIEIYGKAKVFDGDICIIDYVDEEDEEDEE